MRIVLLGILYFIIFNISVAQSSFEIGGFIAPQRTWLKNSPLLKVEGKPTYHLSYGVLAQFITVRKIGIGGGVNISTQGQKYLFKSTDNNVFSKEIVLSYTQYPIYLLYRKRINHFFYLLPKIGIQYGQKKTERIFDGTMSGMVAAELFREEKLDLICGIEADFSVFTSLKVFSSLDFSHSIFTDHSNSKSLILSIRVGAKYVL